MNTIKFKDEKFNRFINKSILIAVMAKLSMKHVIDEVNKIYGKDFIKY